MVNIILATRISGWSNGIQALISHFNELEELEELD